MSRKDVYRQLREENDIPDKAILSWKGWSWHMDGSGGSETDTVSPNAIMFFFEKNLNPPGTMPDTNKQFQTMFIDTLMEYHDMLLRLGTKNSPQEIHLDGSDSQKKKVESWTEISNTLELIAGESKQDQLITYIKNHMNGEWPEIGDIVMEMILDRPDTSINQIQIVSLFRVVMRLKGGRWPEFEQEMKQYIKDQSKQGWTDQTANVLRWSNIYNSLAAGVIGSPELIKYLPTYQDIIGSKPV